MKKLSILFVFCFGLWLLLTASLSVDELIAGLLVSTLVTAISARHSEVFSDLRITPFSILAFVRYLLAFFKALIVANFDVARRVLSPSLPLDPAMVEIRTSLKSDIGKLILANSITLTPGTLSVDIDGDRILIHWIDRPRDMSIEAVSERIAADFEKHIRGFAG